MQKLKNKWMLLLIITVTTNCQSYKGLKMKQYEKEELYVIEVETRRINQECYFMNAEKENNWRHQYMLNLLDDNNEVIPLFNPTNQDKYYCMAHLKKVEKILDKASTVKICARGILERMESDNYIVEKRHDYGVLGVHDSPNYALTFDTICNSKDCFSISKTWTNTCPKGSLDF